MRLVFIKKVSGSKVVFLMLYVKDILLIVNNTYLLKWVNIWLSKNLSKNFSMKDMREATYILEINIYKDRFKRVACIDSIHVHR
jgi:hypothetical protein